MYLHGNLNTRVSLRNPHDKRSRLSTSCHQDLVVYSRWAVIFSIFSGPVTSQLARVHFYGSSRSQSGKLSLQPSQSKNRTFWLWYFVWEIYRFSGLMWSLQLCPTMQSPSTSKLSICFNLCFFVDVQVKLMAHGLHKKIVAQLSTPFTDTFPSLTHFKGNILLPHWLDKDLQRFYFAFW